METCREGAAVGARGCLATLQDQSERRERTNRAACKTSGLPSRKPSLPARLHPMMVPSPSQTAPPAGDFIKYVSLLGLPFPFNPNTICSLKIGHDCQSFPTPLISTFSFDEHYFTSWDPQLCVMPLRKPLNIDSQIW